MRKTLTFLISLVVSMLATAQVVNVASTTKVTLPGGVSVDKAVISPTGTFVVVSDNNARGIKKIDLATGKATVLSQTASGYDVKISSDGNKVLYREYTVDANRLRYTTLKTIDLKTMKSTTIVAKSRDINGTAFVGSEVSVVDNGSMKTKGLSSTASISAPVVSINHGALNLTLKGVTRNLSPQGNAGQSYLWPSISPDGKQVLYYLVGEGCFTCDLSGKNVKKLGALRAARWIDNTTIVGMRDKDNGVAIVESAVIAKNVNTLAEQQISPKGTVALFPSASAKKIVYSTIDGQLYLVTLK